MRRILTCSLLALSSTVFGQSAPDTSKTLKEVIIKPYFSAQPLMRATGAAAALDLRAIELQPNQSLVSAMNTVPGVRMEERSPGSYRLSLRGSLLRSPFGIRNVKIYFDDLPLTDAGGNSYLNALDLSAAGNITILKGPQSSIYGANSGGVVLISPQQLTAPDSSRLGFSLTGGSYGLFRENLSLGKKWKNYQLNLTQSYQRSDGYRDHSGMKRKYIQLNQQWDYHPNASLRALVFYSDLHYDTPGGLTSALYSQNPKLSRPGAGAIKSAIDQQAGIYSKTVFGGITNSWQISSGFKHVLSVFTSYTDFKNPFITNYEHRKEFTLGLRSYVEYSKSGENVNWNANVGLESAKTATDYINSDNSYGSATNLQASDKLNAATNFGFAHLNVDIFRRLLAELSVSANGYKYNYESFFPVSIAKKSNSFDVQFMPRAALSYLIDKNLSARIAVSKGYSPPTLSEIRASDNVINVNLQPEKGWNYETGFRYHTTDQRITADVTGFYYHLENAIVRRLNENDTEYFINAGGTKQWGLETSVSAWIIKLNTSHFVQGLLLSNAYTLSRFKFDNYFDRSVNLSGKDLTGVPKNVVVSSLEVRLPKALYAFVQHTYTSRIQLTDANTVYAAKYNLLQAKVGCKLIKIGKIPFELFAGADNLLNEKYSLGNDLNAAGGRYFNAAASRNFYGGLAMHL